MKIKANRNENKEGLSLGLKGIKIGGILFGGIAGGVIFSFLYVYLLMFFSGTILRVLIIMGTAGAAAAWMVILLRWGHIRSPHWQRILLGVEVLVLYYSQWALYTNLAEDAWLVGMEQLWEYHFMIPKLFIRWIQRCIQPRFILDMLGELVYRGFLSINGQIIKGGALIAVWVAEAVSLLGLPILFMRARMKVPYDENEKVWLNKEEERTISYIKEYRSLRKKIQQSEETEMGWILNEVEAHCPEKGEPFGLITFYKKGRYVGPYISLVNVREVPVGEKRKQRQYIPIAEKLYIGEEAQKIYEKFDSSRASKKGAEALIWIRELKRKLAAGRTDKAQEQEKPTKIYEGNEEVVSLEEMLPNEESR